MPLKRYIHPKMHFPSVDIPTLTTSDGVYKSQDVVELTDEEFKRLDRFFVFEDVEDGDAPAPKKRGKAKDSQSGEVTTDSEPAASTPEDILSEDQGNAAEDVPESDTAPTEPSKG